MFYLYCLSYLAALSLNSVCDLFLLLVYFLLGNLNNFPLDLSGNKLLRASCPLVIAGKFSFLCA